MDDKDIRAYGNPCTQSAQTGPQTIVVRQIIGEQASQLALDIDMQVPKSKPCIEQIIDVLVKDVEINDVDVIRDKVIIRGEFELKAIYVAQLPDLPVHAIEIRHYRWTQYVDIVGARPWMDADASVVVEFVDYDVDDEWYNRGYTFNKYNDDLCDPNCDDDFEDCQPQYDPCPPPAPPAPPKYDPCPPPCPPPAPPAPPKYDPCQPKCDPCDEDEHDDDDCEHHHHHHHHNLRHFHVSVILNVIGKVMADREVSLNNSLPTNTVPYNPKG